MQIKYIRLFIMCLIIFSSTHTIAQNNDKTVIFNGRELNDFYTQPLQKKFSSFTAIQLSSKELAVYCRNSGNSKALRLQLGSKLTFDVELVPSDIVTADYTLQVQTPTGIQTIATHPDFLYKGYTKNGGAVRLAIKEGFISGSIRDKEQEYFIEPMQQYVAGAARDVFVVYEKGAVADQQLICGSENKQGIVENKNTASGAKADSTGGSSCRKVKLFNMTDYSIYKHYGESIEAVENFILTNLNNVEGEYNNFNFNPTDSADVGNDHISFELVANYISTCPTCDLVDSSNDATYILYQLRKGLFKNLGYTTSPYPFIPQYWTMRDIYVVTRQVFGVTGAGASVLKHHSDNPLYLRLVVAHETGHGLGCGHDNEIKPGVTGFIMQAGASTAANRFSRLTDFGGFNYSSNLAIRKTVLDPRFSFFTNCGLSGCDGIAGVKVNYFSNADSCKISWTNTGKFSVNYKLKDVPDFDSSSLVYTDLNTILLKNLLPCTDYVVQVKRECSPGITGPPAFIYVNTTSLKLTDIQPIHKRGELYDVLCRVAGTENFINQCSITIDHTPIQFTYNAATHQLGINDLFADDARHRIDITNKNNDKFCSSPFYYHAPYYRENSTRILPEDFDDCKIPGGWQDSLIQLTPDLSRKYDMVAGKNTSVFTYFISSGNIDSTCMIWGSNAPGEALGITNYGKLIFTSPSLDISLFKNTKLSFDYNFFALKPFSGILKYPSFSVEAFNGNSWRKIFEYNKDLTFLPFHHLSTWDTLPARKFISLDDYTTDNFKVRFIVDDGSYPDSSGSIVNSIVTLALDNIRIDGYPKTTANTTDNMIVFPNPATNEIFINTTFSPGSVITYRIFDLLGRKIQSGQLINNRIDVHRVSTGIFLLQLFDDERSITTRKLIKK